MALRQEKHTMVTAVACWALLGLVVIFDHDYNS